MRTKFIAAVAGVVAAGTSVWIAQQVSRLEQRMMYVEQDINENLTVVVQDIYKSTDLNAIYRGASERVMHLRAEQARWEQRQVEIEKHNNVVGTNPQGGAAA